MANAKHSDPHPVFVGPCKDEIKAALVLAGIPALDIDYSAIERNPTLGARILMSPLPASLDLSEERPAGSKFNTWRADNGELVTRAQRAHLVLNFEVQMWSESLSKTTGLFFDFIRNMPRSSSDQMRRMGIANDTDSGNRIEFVIVHPKLPDETTSTAKQYKATCIVRASGGIYQDRMPSLKVDTKIRIDPHFLP